MTAFLLVAALLALLTVVAVAWPLVRAAAQPREGFAAALVVAVLTGGGGVLYAFWSHWSWQAPVSDGTPQSMVSSLARRLESNPDDLDGWLMLGRSYAALEQFPLAARAYQRADRLAGSRTAEAIEGWAEALTLGNETELVGRAGRLFEQALAIDPTSGKSLFYSAIAAQRRGELSLARARFAALLARNPPENVRPLLAQQIAALDVAIKNVSSASGATQAAAPLAAASTSTASGASARIQLQISLAPALRAQLRRDAPLFVLARMPGQPGPPLAVKRMAAQFPLTVELTAGDSMLPGREISAGQNVVRPHALTEQPGDAPRDDPRFTAARSG